MPHGSPKIEMKLDRDDTQLLNSYGRGINPWHLIQMGMWYSLIQDFRSPWMILRWYNFHCLQSPYNSYLQFCWAC